MLLPLQGVIIYLLFIIPRVIPWAGCSLALQAVGLYSIHPPKALPLGYEIIGLSARHSDKYRWSFSIKVM